MKKIRKNEKIKRKKIEKILTKFKKKEKKFVAELARMTKIKLSKIIGESLTGNQ